MVIEDVQIVTPIQALKMGELGLNEHHQEQLVQFLRFSRYQRDVRLRSVDACFTELQTSRLGETTYTKDEVLDMLASLNAVLRAELESEILNSTHTSVLLLRQLCGQAEQWHLKLVANISELENREMLDAVNQFEKNQFDLNASKQKPTITVLKRLEPMNVDCSPLFKVEIDKLTLENEKLKEKVKIVEKAAIAALEGQKSHAEKLIAEARQNSVNEDDDKTEEELREMESTIDNLKLQMESNMQLSQQQTHNVTEDLTGTKKKLLEIKEQLQMAEKELERKFSATAAYKNMKGMLTKKNDQLKTLRSLLSANKIPLPEQES